MAPTTFWSATLSAPTNSRSGSSPSTWWTCRSSKPTPLRQRKRRRSPSPPRFVERWGLPLARAPAHLPAVALLYSFASDQADEAGRVEIGDLKRFLGCAICNPGTSLNPVSEELTHASSCAAFLGTYPCFSPGSMSIAFWPGL